MFILFRQQPKINLSAIIQKTAMEYNRMVSKVEFRGERLKIVERWRVRNLSYLRLIPLFYANVYIYMRPSNPCLNAACQVSYYWAACGTAQL